MLSAMDRFTPTQFWSFVIGAVSAAVGFALFFAPYPKLLPVMFLMVGALHLLKGACLVAKGNKPHA